MFLLPCPDTEECRALHGEVEEWDPQQRILEVKASETSMLFE